MSAESRVEETIAAVCVGLLACSPVHGMRLAPMFDAMSTDVPTLTWFAVQPWAGPALAVVPAVLLVRSRIGGDRASALLHGALVSGALALGLLLWGWYLPFFRVTSAITG